MTRPSARRPVRRGVWTSRIAESVFAGPTLTDEDARLAYSEQRFQTVGYLEGRMVMVVWTPRDDARHIIAMRKCNEREQARYQKRFDEG